MSDVPFTLKPAADSIALDAARGERGNAGDSLLGVSGGGAGRMVLVADDESHILNVVSLKLRNAGYRVMTAADGLEALEMARQNQPDLLITDYHMPHLSGLELCRRLKQDNRTLHIPAIMLTARGYHLDEKETRDSGIRQMLSKPFSPRHLLLTVNEVLAAKAA